MWFAVFEKWIYIPKEISSFLKIIPLNSVKKNKIQTNPLELVDDYIYMFLHFTAFIYITL